MIGVVTALDGEPIRKARSRARMWTATTIPGFRCLPRERRQPRATATSDARRFYYINTWGVQIEQNPMTDVPIGYVGVVISYIGEDGKDVTGDTFKHGNIVSKGQRGVWMEPLGGQVRAQQVRDQRARTRARPAWCSTGITMRALTNRTAWTKTCRRSRCVQKTVSRSSLDVAQIIHVPANEAAQGDCAFLGALTNLVSQVLEARRSGTISGTRRRTAT